MAYNKIRLNHVGFTVNSIKRFVIPDKPECEEFKVYKIDNCKHIECFSGKITEEYTGSGIGYFTEVKEPGDFSRFCFFLKDVL